MTSAHIFHKKQRPCEIPAVTPSVKHVLRRSSLWVQVSGGGPNLCFSIDCLPLSRQNQCEEVEYEFLKSNLPQGRLLQPMVNQWQAGLLPPLLSLIIPVIMFLADLFL